MTNLSNKILVYEEGRRKIIKELRLYRYPSQNYINCLNRLNMLEAALKRMYAEKAVADFEIQLKIWN